MRAHHTSNSMKKKNLTPKTLSLCGIFLIFTLFFLFLASSTTSVQMVSYCLSSIFILIILEESNWVTGISFYVASSLLALLLLPNKLAIVPYILFFGHYGIWYHWYSRTSKKILVHALNYLIANISIFTLYFTCKELFTNLRIPTFLLFVPIVEVFIVLYDYMYGRCLYYYRRDIKSKLPQ
ncbi:hypothetical protein [Anaerosporobacter faecicola]|uniref:hypothetical protein n=1 Tax=Anaerosporobacter faecicola TaxID=2718714 RepID=UPI001438C70E|nr:hypothetical protein [Anaerosporobacter faecicola]